MVLFKVLVKLHFQLLYIGLKRVVLDVAGGEASCMVTGTVVQAPA